MKALFGLSGFSGSGKTTLMCALLPLLSARNLRISTVKHAHHSFDVDRKGKDSYRHREAGATEVVISSKNRWALMHENRGGAEPELDDLLQQMSAVDLVLVEGFKAHNFPKLFIHRSAFQQQLSPKDLEAFEGVVAIATDDPLSVDHAISIPLLDLNDHQALAEYILQTTGLGS